MRRARGVVLRGSACVVARAMRMARAKGFGPAAMVMRRAGDVARVAASRGSA